MRPFEKGMRPLRILKIVERILGNVYEIGLMEKNSR